MGNADTKLHFREAVLQLTTKTQVMKLFVQFHIMGYFSFCEYILVFLVAYNMSRNSNMSYCPIAVMAINGTVYNYII